MRSPWPVSAGGAPVSTLQRCDHFCHPAAFSMPSPGTRYSILTKTAVKADLKPGPWPLSPLPTEGPPRGPHPSPTPGPTNPDSQAPGKAGGLVHPLRTQGPSRLQLPKFVLPGLSRQSRVAPALPGHSPTSAASLLPPTLLAPAAPQFPRRQRGLAVASLLQSV